MSNYSVLKALLDTKFYENSDNDITGTKANEAVKAMVASLGDGYQFMGAATPATSLGTPDERVFYIAVTAGNYDQGLVVPEGLSALIYDSSWSCVTFLNGSFDDFVRKEYSENLVNPAETIDSRYIAPDGSIPAGSPGFFVSDYIEIDGNDISIKGVYGGPAASDSIRPWVAYNSSKQVTRVGLTPHTNPGDTCLYEFDAVNYPNDYYIRIGFRLDDPKDARANYGDTLIDVDFSDYKPVADLEARVSALEDEIRPASVSLLYYPNAVYKVWNDLEVSRQYVVKLGLSRMLEAGAYKNSGLHFDNNKLRNLPLVPSKILSKQEQSLTFSVSNVSITTKERTALASDGENATPRILVIGDSVTAGYGAGANKAPSWLPSCYWAFAKMFFEMDKIDNGGSGHEVLFTGINDGDFTLDYNGTHSVRAKAVAKGGARLDELFKQYWGEGGNTPNPFYDSDNNTFSVNAYLKNYRTMDDLGVRLVSALADPHGATAIGSDGLTYTIGQLIDTQEKLASYDVCTPTHIFVNLNHNTPGNVFVTSVTSLLTKIKNELPGCAFAWVVIDSTGTNFPKDFPDFEPAFIGLDNYVHSHDNSFFNWVRDNLEDENNGVYLLGLNFIQPEAVDAPFTECAINENRKFYVADTLVSGPHYHPNNICHCDWGYELYAFIKWLIS